MIVSLLPRTSANLVTKSAPKKEPAGMDATMAPWALDPGWPNVLLYASFWSKVSKQSLDQGGGMRTLKTPDMDEMSKPNSPPPIHANDPTRY